MKTLAIIACVVIVLIIAVKLFIRSHVNWLAKQTPVGVWTTQYEGSTITLQFELGPNKEGVQEGLYQQMEKTQNGKETREFGHWFAHMNDLRMLIMGSQINNHPRFGLDTTYVVRYVGPDSISINGPDRPDLIYTRAPEGTVLDFGKEVEQSPAGDDLKAAPDE